MIRFEFFVKLSFCKWRKKKMKTKNKSEIYLTKWYQTIYDLKSYLKRIEFNLILNDWLTDCCIAFRKRYPNENSLNHFD